MQCKDCNIDLCEAAAQSKANGVPELIPMYGSTNGSILCIFAPGLDTMYDATIYGMTTVRSCIHLYILTHLYTYMTILSDLKDLGHNLIITTSQS